MPKLTDAELISAIEAEEGTALDGTTGTLAGDRAEAIKRWKGDLLGNEQEGRSQVVSRDLMDTIEWIAPSLARIFLGGNEIGKFEPRGPEDEDAAETETQVCNWYLENKNDSFSQVMATMKDALLLRNGYLLAFWKERTDTMTERYVGLADEEAAIILDDDEVKVVEHTQYSEGEQRGEYGSAGAEPMAAGASMPPDPMMGGQAMPGMGMTPPVAGIPPELPRTLHDIKVERKQAEETVAVESVPPDEILVSRRHRWTSMLDADFVQWRHRTTIGELRAQGYKVPDDAPGEDEYTEEATNRARFEETAYSDDEGPDPARRVVTVKETWIRIDLNNTGQQQLWRVCHIAGSRDVLLREEAEIIPIAAFTPIIYPHSHVGTSVDDLVTDLSLIKTTLTRQLLDNVYLQNSGRLAVDANRVNLDDLLVNRPGGVVRVDGPLADAMLPIVAPDAGPSIMSALEYIDAVKEGRTGVTRYSAGLDANSLNKTATGVQQIQAAANQRIELIARTMATGFRDLFLIIHALACKHSTKPLQIKLNNEWTVINPREWTRRTDFAITVGLGTGTPEQMAMKLQSMMPFMAQGSQLGLVGPDEFYNWGVEYVKALGYRSPDKFMKEPQKDPQTGKAMTPQPPPPPEVQVEQIRQQGKAQEFQAKTQIEMQSMQAKAQAEMQATQLKAALDKEQTANQMAQEQRKAQMEYELRQQEMQNDKEIALYKAELEQQTAIRLKQMDIAAQTGMAEAGEVGKVNSDAGLQMMSEQKGLFEELRNIVAQLAESSAMPKRIVRDPLTGRVVGVVPDRKLQ